MPLYDQRAVAGEPMAAPQVTAWNTVASFATYAEAQAAVDQLAAVGFPVHEIEIVGSGLRSVERVTGPMSTGRAVASYAGTGAWFGLLIGLLVGFFTAGPDFIGLIVGGIVIGGLWGAVFGAAARWMSRGHHNFSSLHSVVATRYDVIALDGVAGQARAALGFGGPPASYGPPNGGAVSPTTGNAQQAAGGPGASGIPGTPAGSHRG